MSGNEMRGKMAPYVQQFQALDNVISSALSKEELAQVRKEMDGFKVNNENAAKYGRDPALAMNKMRMESLKSVLSPERIKSSGLNQLVDMYNQQFSLIEDREKTQIADAYKQYQDSSKYDPDDYRGSLYDIEMASMKEPWYAYAEKYGFSDEIDPDDTRQRFDINKTLNEYNEQMNFYRV